MEKRICFAIPDLSIGGSSSVVFQLCQHFSENGYKVLLLTAYNHIADRYKEILFLKNVTFITCNKKNFLDYKWISKMRKFLIEFNPDIINSHLSMTFYISLLNLPYPLFHTIHTSPKKDMFFFQRMYLKKYQKKNNLSFIACSNSVYVDSLKVYKKEKLFLAQNGFLNSDEGIAINIDQTKKFDLLFVGRFDKVKNLSFLLRCFKKLSIIKPGISLCLCGAGDQYNKVKKIIAKINLKNVYMPGFVNDLKAFYSSSSIFCLFSKREGGPLCIVEANSYGLPVVCSDIPGNRNYVKEGYNGFLFKFNQQDLIVHRVLNLLSDKENYQIISRNAFLSAKENSFANTYLKYKEIFENEKKC